ncbi:MAG: chemotaxis protein CheW [Desulfuromonadales bacterium]|nr:chemotaxis protein CheW [Desulfuromonadales bacterium]
MKQLLPFMVGYETYALELAEVQEVVEDQTIYPFPGAPAAIAGAISFHGRIITVIDLAQLLNFPAGKIGRRIIVLVNQRGPVALGVDQVHKIINLATEPTKKREKYSEENCITAIINHAGKMINLLDLEQLQLQLEELCSETGGGVV